MSNCNRVINSFAFTDAPTNGAYHYDQSSFGKVCQRILYYIENEECCAGNDKPLSYFTSADDAHGIPSSTGLETRNIQKKDKPTTGEGELSLTFFFFTVIATACVVFLESC